VFGGFPVLLVFPRKMTGARADAWTASLKLWQTATAPCVDGGLRICRGELGLGPRQKWAPGEIAGYVAPADKTGNVALSTAGAYSSPL